MRMTKSLCPECLTVIDAAIIEENGKIFLEKKCGQHGVFKETYWSNAEQFHRFAKYWHDGEGLKNPHTKSNSNCPYDCGLCISHKTATILANIDVTNRCNQKCPVCFANAAVSGYLYEPTLDEIRNMMLMLRKEEPVPCPSIQFSGGEPTVREDIVELVKIARDLDFTQIQMATNGIRLAQSPELCRKLADAGLQTVYLQFDGISEEPYRTTRGYNALPIKLKALENCNNNGLNSVALVPTLVKGVNDSQVGDIVRFAARNMNVIKGVNFQPVSFAGRINREERENQRITIPDLLLLLETQTGGELARTDFYPVPFIVPITHFTNSEKGYPNVEFTVHPHCGTGTYIYVEDGKLTPITRFIDVEGLIEHIEELAGGIDQSRVKPIGKLMGIQKLIKSIPRFIDTSKAPKGVDVKKLFLNVLKEGSGEVIKEFHRNTLFVGAMHFMDLYNMDLERVQRCGVHYATPDGRVIPFCTYNTLHRESVEKKFAKPLKSVVLA